MEFNFECSLFKIKINSVSYSAKESNCIAEYHIKEKIIIFYKKHEDFKTFARILRHEISHAVENQNKDLVMNPFTLANNITYSNVLFNEIDMKIGEWFACWVDVLSLVFLGESYIAFEKECFENIYKPNIDLWDLSSSELTICRPPLVGPTPYIYEKTPMIKKGGE